MKVYGDIESVNLHTGERFQRVTGDGESRLVRVTVPEEGDTITGPWEKLLYPEGTVVNRPSGRFIVKEGVLTRG